MCPDLKAFEHYCRERGVAFQALTPLGGEQVEVRFTGHLRGRPVLWQATIMTLQYFRRHRRGDSPGGQRQFIEVGEPAQLGRRIEIGLDTPRIDEATIHKTMIMVRQWKNLDIGLHEFSGG